MPHRCTKEHEKMMHVDETQMNERAPRMHEAK